MDKKCALGSELLYDRERFLEAKMRGVRLDANTIESEYIETAQPFLRFLRHDLEIRDVCEVVKTICDDRQLAVNDLERRHFNIRPDAKGRARHHRMRYQLRK